MSTTAIREYNHIKLAAVDDDAWSVKHFNRILMNYDIISWTKTGEVK